MSAQRGPIFVSNDTTLTSEPNDSSEAESISPSLPKTDRITRWILTAIGIYTGRVLAARVQNLCGPARGGHSGAGDERASFLAATMGGRRAVR